MNKFNQYLCNHCAVVFALFLGAGAFGVTGWLPVVPPSISPEALVTMFQTDTMSIRIGVMFMEVGAAFAWPWSAAMSIQMRRIEGQHSALSLAQFGTASGGAIAVMVPAYIWLAVAYRPDSLDVSTLQLMNDYAWLMFIGAFGPGLVQTLCLGFCIIGDKSSDPVYPRWLGYANFWIAFTFLPGALLPFFQSGPFAWNGIIGFWFVGAAFFTWILLMWFMTHRAIKNQN